MNVDIAALEPNGGLGTVSRICGRQAYGVQADDRKLIFPLPLSVGHAVPANRRIERKGLTAVFEVAAAKEQEPFRRRGQSFSVLGCQDNIGCVVRSAERALQQ